jgi:GGDEF domain-containing protein
MAAQTLTRIALVSINLALMASWAWFAADALGAPAAIGALLVLLAIEAFLWLRLTSSSMETPGSQPGRSVDRVSALIARPERRRQSIREESTGLFHRWYLEMRLEQEALRCQRYKHSMAVIVLQAGAVNLSEFSMDSWQVQSLETAERCTKAVRNIDLSAFLAPMEYALCLVQCDTAGAENALERLRAELSEYKVDAGIAVYPDDGCEPLALIDLARRRSREEVESVLQPQL